MSEHFKNAVYCTGPHQLAVATAILRQRGVDPSTVLLVIFARSYGTDLEDHIVQYAKRFSYKYILTIAPSVVDGKSTAEWLSMVMDRSLKPPDFQKALGFETILPTVEKFLFHSAPLLPEIIVLRALNPVEHIEYEDGIGYYFNVSRYDQNFGCLALKSVVKTLRSILSFGAAPEKSVFSVLKERRLLGILEPKMTYVSHPKLHQQRSRIPCKRISQEDTMKAFSELCQDSDLAKNVFSGRDVILLGNNFHEFSQVPLEKEVGFYMEILDNLNARAPVMKLHPRSCHRKKVLLREALEKRGGQMIDNSYLPLESLVLNSNLASNLIFVSSPCSFIMNMSLWGIGNFVLVDTKYVNRKLGTAFPVELDEYIRSCVPYVDSITASPGSY